MDFTYRHNSGHTSAFDFILCSYNVKRPSKATVIADFQSLGRLPIRNSHVLPINLPDAPNPVSTNDRHVVTDWSKIDLLVFQCISDNILQNIKVPYQMLGKISCINTKEKQVLLNIYYAEIVYALHVAEKQSVPKR